MKFSVWYVCADDVQIDVSLWGVRYMKFPIRGRLSFSREGEAGLPFLEILEGESLFISESRVVRSSLEFLRLRTGLRIEEVMKSSEL